MLLQFIISTTLSMFAGATLCCHAHADGFIGCWPAKAGECPDGSVAKNCRAGATQSDPDDEESWVCDGAPNS